MADEVHTSATSEEAAFAVRWTAGEPSFGPDYCREGDLDRFFQWQRIQHRLRWLGS